MKAGNIIVQRAVFIALLAIAIGGTWYFARQDLRTCVVDDNLQPIASLLGQNRKTMQELKSSGYAESESTLLDSYLARIRRDGAPPNSGMKQRIDSLVNNNTVIAAFLAKYAPHARGSAFKAAAEQYRNYAISFRDRWQSVFEIFMAGGNLPAAGPEYPAQFAATLDQELRDN